MQRNVREMRLDEADLMITYFLNADEVFLRGMGADPEKLPSLAEWRDLLQADFDRPVAERQFYYLFWELDGQPIGHSNINKLRFGEEAFMHLHLWDVTKRQRGNGVYFLTECINRYFEQFQLKNLFCEPYALNPSPNKTLPKLGFELVQQYETTPGWLNFHQPVNRWLLTRDKWLQLASAKG